MIKTEAKPTYTVRSRKDEEDAIIAQAIQILESRVCHGRVISSPGDAIDYIRLKYAELDHEVFGVLYLTNRNAVIDAEEVLFTGTIDQAAVFPREVLKKVLAKGAAQVILFHNHPADIPEPSKSDERITRKLQEALKLIDVKVLDHVVVSRSGSVSFAERGLLL